MVFCDNCSTQDIASERYTCLPCSGDEVLGSIDLCSNCMDKPLTVLNVSGIQKEHLTSHHLLQTRVPYGTRYAFFVRGRAKACVESLLQGDTSEVPQTCASCRETISRPYWFCESCRTEGENSWFSVTIYPHSELHGNFDRQMACIRTSVFDAMTISQNHARGL